MRLCRSNRLIHSISRAAPLSQSPSQIFLNHWIKWKTQIRPSSPQIAQAVAAKITRSVDSVEVPPDVSAFLAANKVQYISLNQKPQALANLIISLLQRHDKHNSYFLLADIEKDAHIPIADKLYIVNEIYSDPSLPDLLSSPLIARIILAAEQDDPTFTVKDLAPLARWKYCRGLRKLDPQLDNNIQRVQQAWTADFVPLACISRPKLLDLLWAVSQSSASPSIVFPLSIQILQDLIRSGTAHTRAIPLANMSQVLNDRNNPDFPPEELRVNLRVVMAQIVIMAQLEQGAWRKIVSYLNDLGMHHQSTTLKLDSFYIEIATALSGMASTAYSISELSNLTYLTLSGKTSFSRSASAIIIHHPTFLRHLFDTAIRMDDQTSISSCISIFELLDSQTRWDAIGVDRVIAAWKRDPVPWLTNELLAACEKQDFQPSQVGWADIWESLAFIADDNKAKTIPKLFLKFLASGILLQREGLLALVRYFMSVHNRSFALKAIKRFMGQEATKKAPADMRALALAYKAVKLPDYAVCALRRLIRYQIVPETEDLVLLFELVKDDDPEAYAQLREAAQKLGILLERLEDANKVTKPTTNNAIT